MVLVLVGPLLLKDGFVFFCYFWVLDFNLCLVLLGSLMVALSMCSSWLRLYPRGLVWFWVRLACLSSQTKRRWTFAPRQTQGSDSSPRFSLLRLKLRQNIWVRMKYPNSLKIQTSQIRILLSFSIFLWVVHGLLSRVFCESLRSAGSAKCFWRRCSSLWAWQVFARLQDLAVLNIKRTVACLNYGSGGSSVFGAESLLLLCIKLKC